MVMRRKKAPQQRRDEGDESRGPTHYLKMKSAARDGSGWSRVGAVWENRSGNLTIKLGRGVVLDWHDFDGPAPEFTLIIVPAD